MVAGVGYLYIYSILDNQNLNEFYDIRQDRLSKSVDENTGKSEYSLYEQCFKHKTQFGKLPDLETVYKWGYPKVKLQESLDFYKNEVSRRDIQNAITLFFNKKILPKLKQGGWESSEIIEHISDLNAYVQEQSTNDVKQLHEIAKNTLLEIQQSKFGKIKKVIPYQWPSLDRVTNGGMHGGDMVIFVARPAKGKSSILAAHSYKTWRMGFTPLVYSMELTDQDFANRIMASYSEFNPNKLRSMVFTNDLEEKVKEAVDYIENAPPFYIVDGGLKKTVRDIQANVEKLKPDIVYIDAAYLVSAAMSAAKKFEKLEQVSDELKMMALNMHVPVFMTVQFNRDSAKKNGGYNLENIGGTDNYAKLGTLVAAITDSEFAIDGERRTISVIKNRYGSEVEFDVNFLFDPPNFDEIETAESDTGSNENDTLENDIFTI